MTTPKTTVTCKHCELVQYAASNCKRCKKKLCVKINFEPISPRPSLWEWPEVLPTVKELELEVVREAMRRCNGNRKKAAKMVGIGKTTIYRKYSDADLLS